jgi:integration host factor subunit beta
MVSWEVPKTSTCIQPLKFEKVMHAGDLPGSLLRSRSAGTPDELQIDGLGGGVMTKADLIDEVSRLAELTRKDSEVIVETIFDSVVRSLRAGDKIEIRGFGSFRTRQRRPRVGRNPKTGERVEVPAKKIPFFKPSKELKDLVNETTAGAAPATAAPPATPGPPTT